VPEGPESSSAVGFDGPSFLSRQKETIGDEFFFEFGYEERKFLKRVSPQRHEVWV
jgi:hypothetical protein